MTGEIFLHCHECVKALLGLKTSTSSQTCLLEAGLPSVKALVRDKEAKFLHNMKHQLTVQWSVVFCTVLMTCHELKLNRTLFQVKYTFAVWSRSCIAHCLRSTFTGFSHKLHIELGVTNQLTMPAIVMSARTALRIKNMDCYILRFMTFVYTLNNSNDLSSLFIGTDRKVLVVLAWQNWNIFCVDRMVLYTEYWLVIGKVILCLYCDIWTN